MSSFLPNDLIISVFEQHLAVKPDAVQITARQDDDFVQAYQVETDQGSFVLRMAPSEANQHLFFEYNMLPREANLLAKLRNQTTIPIPDVVVADFDHQLVDYDFMIIRAVPGVVYSQISTLNHAQHDRVYTQLGTFLQQLHAICGTYYGYNGPSSALAGQPNWKQAFAGMWRSLIQDVQNCGLYNREEAESLVDLFESYSAYFDHSVSPCLLHMGIRKENIIVDTKGNINGLLGFETALWGDPELDFAVLDCSGIWASAFWTGYGQVRPNDLGSRTRRKFYMLYEVQRHIPLTLNRYHDPEEAEQYKQTAMTIATNLASLEP